MTFKQARAEARIGNSYGCAYMTLSKQKEIGWFVEKAPTQRSVYWVNKDGRLTLLNTDFARNYQRGRGKKK